jgi:small GTP-binding protein
MIGSASVGKTSLINRIVDDKFEQLTTPTTGTAFFSYTPTESEHQEIQLWDTAGMERYRSLNSVFYREAVGAILTFDLTSYASFQELDSWLNDFISNTGPNPSVVIAANKCDLTDQVEVEDDEIEIFATEHHLMFYKTSAVTGEGVNEMLSNLLNMIPVVANIVETRLAELPPEDKCKC